MARDYLRDPAAIRRESFAIIRRESDLSLIPEDLVDTVIRMVHACGMPEIVGDLAFSPDAAEAGGAALRAAATILTDSRMVAHGISLGLLPASNALVCLAHETTVKALAARLGTTRSAAAVDLWRPHLEGAVVAIGTAPTALFRLLELLDEGVPRPALIIATPAGFVGAAQAKEALIAGAHDVPYLTLRGRRGGSAVAAAAVNALAAAA